jgi:hypothetical protein
MWKYNKYNICDVVRHKENQVLEFQVTDILCGVPEKNGDYLYSCELINKKVKDINKEYKYHEKDLQLIRKANLDELNKYLREVILKEDFEKAGAIQNEINKRKI